MSDKYPDTHGVVSRPTTECVVITIPVTGWYLINGVGRIHLTAGDQFVLNGPTFARKTGDMKDDK